MNEPNMKDFDRWKSDPVGQWFFGQFDINGDCIIPGFLQKQADLIAAENGRALGMLENKDIDHMRSVRMAGFVSGVEDVILNDPFSDERVEEVVDEEGNTD